MCNEGNVARRSIREGFEEKECVHLWPPFFHIPSLNLSKRNWLFKSDGDRTPSLVTLVLIFLFFISKEAPERPICTD